MKHIIQFISLASIFFLTCSPNDIVTVNTDNDYAKAVIDLKKNGAHIDDFEDKLLELRTKFKMPTNLNIPTRNQPIVEKPIIKKSDKCENYSAFLAKRANIIGAAVKTATCPIERPYFGSYAVPNNSSITAYCSNGSSGVDPFMIFYEITNGNLWDFELRQKLAVLNYNDDYNGLLPRCTYSNYSGTEKRVVILVFSYSQSSKGTANLNITVNGSSWTEYNIYIGATALFYDNNSIDGNGNYINLGNYSQYAIGAYAFCADSVYMGPDYTWGSYKPYSSGDSYIWVFNFATGRGIANDDSPNSSAASVITELDWTTFPSGYHYPNLVLIGGWSNYGTMKFIQFGAFQN
jgi:hypothetical protein